MSFAKYLCIQGNNAVPLLHIAVRRGEEAQLESSVIENNTGRSFYQGHDAIENNIVASIERLETAYSQAANELRLTIAESAR